MSIEFCFALPLALAAAPQGELVPPGMVLIRGGTTTIGRSVKDVEAFGQAYDLGFNSAVRETPEHKVEVDDFFLMVNEVSNEQYAAYVRASGVPPPWTWGEKATEAGRAQFLEEQAQAIRAAQAAGEPVPERARFDASAWWAKNWAGQEWQVPPGQEARPVVWVDYREASAYARWAGLRLMTEFEYQRAGRGDGDGLYPWGDEPPDSGRLATQDSRISDPLAAGALPEGASPEGVHHLLGNVWEWTSSPFQPYPDYEDFSIEVGNGDQKRTLGGLTQWDANKRVVVGGSFQNPAVDARLTVRRGAERDEATNSLGLRCAASSMPGRDVAEAVLKEDVPPSSRPRGVEYDASRTLATDRWTSNPGVAAVAGYAVITDYDHALFIPAVDVPVTSTKELGEASQDAPVPLGVFSTTVPLLEPALAPGAYVVAFRGQGKPVVEASAPSAEGELAPPARLPEGYPWEQDAFLFYRPDGEPVAWLALDHADLQYVRAQVQQVTLVDTTRQVDTGEVDPKGNPILVDEPIQVASFKTNAWVVVSNKALSFTLRAVAAPGTFDGWRR